MNEIIGVDYQVFYELRSMSTDVFDGLEDVDFAVLNDLFDAGIGREINANSRCSVPSFDRDRENSNFFINLDTNLTLFGPELVSK